MADPVSPDIVSPIMEAVRACAAERLSAHGRPVARSGLVSGTDVVADECCDGYLYVRLVTMFPSGKPFPQQDTQAGDCKAILMASQLAVGVFRCIPVIQEGGGLPTAEELNTAALGAHADAMILLAALKCCLDPQTVTNLEAVVLGAWTPRQNLGGCGGGEWGLTIGHGTCRCEDPA